MYKIIIQNFIRIFQFSVVKARIKIVPVAVGDLAKARGLENVDRLIAREPVYAAMVYV